MSEPSKEALKLASKLAVGMLESRMTGNFRDPEADIAAALQKLMDERDGWQILHDRECERAQTAESQRDDSRTAYSLLANKIAEVLVRAEAAEERLELRELACDEAVAEERRHREAAERKVTLVIDAVLAQLRTWLDMHDSGLPAPSSAALRGLIAHLEALP